MGTNLNYPLQVAGYSLRGELSCGLRAGGLSESLAADMHESELTNAGTRMRIFADALANPFIPLKLGRGPWPKIS